MRKPTKWHVRPEKTQISLGIRPVWSVFTVCSIGSLGPNVSSRGQRRLRSDWADLSAQVILLVLSCGGSFVLMYFEVGTFGSEKKQQHPHQVKQWDHDDYPIQLLETLHIAHQFEPRHEKMCLRMSPTSQDTNRPAQPQKLASVSKFWL